MSGLLRANFSRMWKTMSFWVCLIFPAAIHVFFKLIDGGKSYEIFGAMKGTTLMSLFFSAIFAVMYIGTDNSDRTLRNKIVIGKPRAKVYFANLTAVSGGMALIFAASWLTVIVLGLIQGRNFGEHARQIPLYMVLCLIAGTAMMAVCALPATLVTSKSLATALTIVLTIGMFIGTLYLPRLSTGPEHYKVMTTDRYTGETVVVEEYDDYTFVVSGGVKKAAKVLYNALPTSQISEFGSGFPHLFFLEPLMYSLGVGTAAAVVGVAAFRKKDLK